MNELDTGAPQPFESRPRDAAAFGGCSKPVLIGCGALFVLLGIASLAFLLKAKDLFGWAIEKHQAIIVENLPPEVTDAEKRRLAAAYASVIEAVENGKADPAGLQELQRALSGAASRAERLTRQDVLELTEALEAVAGAESPGPARQPDLPPEISPGVTSALLSAPVLA